MSDIKAKTKNYRKWLKSDAISEVEAALAEFKQDPDFDEKGAAWIQLKEAIYAITYEEGLSTNQSDSIWWEISFEAKQISVTIETIDYSQKTANPYNSPKPNGMFEDICLLGIGGMGEVRRVKDVELNCYLAMKIIHRRLMSSTQSCTRFMQEAQIVAQLQHPNIPPVHSLGELPDGRLFFTMREIAGDHFKSAIEAVHQHSHEKSPWTFRRLIEVFRAVCEAMAYAHEKGVIHRDLKPANIMVGAFGDVLVVDWGLAKLVNQVDWADDTEPVSVLGISTEHSGHGVIKGTPSYMAPEQALGYNVDHRADIYALGAILYHILVGERPFGRGNPESILARVIEEGPAPLRERLQKKSMTKNQPMTGFFQPEQAAEELISICEQALEKDPNDRPQSVQGLVAAVGGWLDGATKRDRALEVVAEALATVDKEEHLQQLAKKMAEEAKNILKEIPSHAGSDQKKAGWEKEDAATDLSRQANQQRAIREQLLLGALTHKPDLPEAHVALAEHYRQEHSEAETRGDLDAVWRAEQRLAQHVEALPIKHPRRAALAAYLQGDGFLNIETEPAGAMVTISRYERIARRLQPVNEISLGKTPVLQERIEMGSYRITLTKSGFATSVYPIAIDRMGEWSCTLGDQIQAIKLQKETTIETGECLVPSGWFQFGGDSGSASSAERQKIWVDGFIIQEHPVTNREYIEFLNSLMRKGRKEEALRHVPRERAGKAHESGAMIYGLNDDNEFFLCPDEDGDVWEMDYPVCFIDWFAAKAYADWMAEAKSLPYRLPTEHEWEKAARGVDGRPYPWGWEFDPSWCCVRESHAGRPLPHKVNAFPKDKSPYGVLGMAGNMSEWTASIYQPNGPSVDKDGFSESSNQDIDDESFVVFRGGSWSALSRYARIADRARALAPSRGGNLGFRICRSDREI